MDPVRFGVIGAGGIADKRTMPGMLNCPDAKLVAFAEVVPERREELREKYGVKAYADAEALLRDPDVECVYIASPLRFHKEQAFAALDAGKHMLLEKPLGLNAAEAVEIDAYARKSGLVTAAGFMMRFHAVHQKLRDLVQSGALGDLISCRAQFGCWTVQNNQKWRHVKGLGGGGSLMDMGIHAIDLLTYITGRKVESVAAFNSTLAHTFDVEDTSGVMMKFDNGMVGYVDSYFSMPTDCSRIEINGTRGIVVADGTLDQVERGTMQAFCGNGMTAEEQAEFIRSACDVRLPEDGRYTCYTKEIEAMCRSIRLGEKAIVPLCDAVEDQRIIEAAYTSGENGCIIKLH